MRPEETEENLEGFGPYLDLEANDALTGLDERNAPEETETSPEEEDTDISPEEEVTEEPTEETETSPEEEDTAKEDRPDTTVPIGALHEERERRKSIQQQLDERSRQLDEILASYKQIKDKDEVGIPPEDEYERKEWERDRELADLKKRVQATEQHSQQRAQEQAEQRLENSLDVVAKELKKEGYPGFKTFVPVLNQKLLDLVAEDPINRNLQNPEGWKKVYREQIFPDARKFFIGQDRNRLFEEKKRLKEKANLTTSPGKQAKQKKKEEDKYSFDDYQKERQRESSERKKATLW